MGLRGGWRLRGNGACRRSILRAGVTDLAPSLHHTPELDPSGQFFSVGVPGEKLTRKRNALSPALARARSAS